MLCKVPGAPDASTQLGKTIGVIALKTEPALADSAATSLRESAGRKLAMHIVAAKPQFLSAAQVSPTFIEAERAIFVEQMKEDESSGKKKSPEVLEKILGGKVQKRLAEVCLLSQGHLAEEGNPVIQKHLEAVGKSVGAQVTVKDFALWALQQD